MKYLGIDTSNYTTSCALFDTDTGRVLEKRRLLPVKEGELGLRQADAVFHHTVQLPVLMKELFNDRELRPDAVAVSVSPRDEEGSYMPCFMTGKCVADCIAASFSVPVYYFSHQAGHITAALYSAGRLDLLHEPFIAFHVSGGTTEAVRVSPDGEKVFSTSLVASSLDLKAGQAIDRVGKMLGLSFPSGPALDELSRKSEKQYKIKPYVRDTDCSFSGVQNRCRKMIDEGELSCDVARYCIEYITSALEAITDGLLVKFPADSLIYSGGVMSNTLVRERFTAKYGAVFSAPGYSSDNAVGTAVLAALKEGTYAL